MDIKVELSKSCFFHPCAGFLTKPVDFREDRFQDDGMLWDFRALAFVLEVPSL